MIGQGSAPGTCGELVQGQFKDGTDFLVTFPIDLRSHVTVELNPDSSAVAVYPTTKVKTRQAVRSALDIAGYATWGAQVKVSSDLPEGKGMASSTADIVAACRAVAEATDTKFDEPAISRIAGQIEPSDGIMYSGVVCYNHRRCELIEQLGSLPACSVLIIDFGGELDTIMFNQKRKAYHNGDLEMISEAYTLVRDGIAQQSLKLVGQAALLSARVNQRLLPQSQLETLVDIAEDCSSYGVNVAHSGTAAGMIFDPKDEHVLPDVQQVIKEKTNQEITFYVTHATNN